VKPSLEIDSTFFGAGASYTPSHVSAPLFLLGPARAKGTLAFSAMADRLELVIDATQQMLSKLKTGLSDGERLVALKKLATEVAIAATLIETLIDTRIQDSRDARLRATIRDSQKNTRE
jgi:hypothetical protein